MVTSPVIDVFYDEEECLPFDVFVAELELLVGNKQSKPDGVALLQLLQKMIATINRTERKILKQYQKRCEGIFTDLLAVGASPVVRWIIDDATKYDARIAKVWTRNNLHAGKFSGCCTLSVMSPCVS